MNKTQDVRPQPDRDQGDRFVARLIADIPGLSFVLFGDRGQEPGGPVHVERAALGIEGQSGVGGPFDNVNAHAAIRF